MNEAQDFMKQWFYSNYWLNKPSKSKTRQRNHSSLNPNRTGVHLKRIKPNRKAIIKQMFLMWDIKANKHFKFNKQQKIDTVKYPDLLKAKGIGILPVECELTEAGERFLKQCNENTEKYGNVLGIDYSNEDIREHVFTEINKVTQIGDKFYYHADIIETIGYGMEFGSEVAFLKYESGKIIKRNSVWFNMFCTLIR